MPRLSLLLLSLVGLFLIAGCGGSSSESTGKYGLPPAEEQEYKEYLRRKQEHQKKREQQAGSTESGGSEPASPKPAPSSVRNTEATTCGSYGGVSGGACKLAYEICSAEAKQVVESYYHGTGTPSLDTYAEHYANENSTEEAWEGGFAGCLGALMAEYERLYA